MWVEVEKEGGYISVKSPFNPTFVKVARSLNGSWDGEEWVFSESAETTLKEKCLEIYGEYDEEVERLNVTIDVDLDVNQRSLILYGRPVLARWHYDQQVFVQAGADCVSLEARGSCGTPSRPMIGPVKARIKVLGVPKDLDPEQAVSILDSEPYTPIEMAETALKKSKSQKGNSEARLMISERRVENLTEELGRLKTQLEIARRDNNQLEATINELREELKDRQISGEVVECFLEALNQARELKLADTGSLNVFALAMAQREKEKLRLLSKPLGRPSKW